MAKPVVNKGVKLPHVFAILFLLTIVMAIATWFVPAGTYEMVLNEATKRKVIVPNSFHFIASNPQGVYDVFNAIVKGMIQSASMMSMVFFCGAAVEVLNQTGTMKAGMGSLVGVLKGKGVIAVVTIMAVMSIGGAVGVFANPTIAFIPLGVMLGKTMGYDEVVGWAMIYLGSYAGFNVGWANAFTAGLANELSGLDTMNGFWLRVVFHIANLILLCWFVVRYMHKIEKDPTASLTYDPAAREAAGQVHRLRHRHRARLRGHHLRLGRRLPRVPRLVRLQGHGRQEVGRASVLGRVRDHGHRLRHGRLPGRSLRSS